MPETHEGSERYRAALVAGRAAMREDGRRFLNSDQALAAGLTAAIEAMEHKSKEIEEARERAQGQFLTLVHRLVGYWLGDVPAAYSTASRLDGFTHSLLAELDGCGDGTYELIALDDQTGYRLDIAGGLHEGMRRVASPGSGD